MNYKTNYSAPFPNQDDLAEPPEIENLLLKIDEKYDLAESLIKSLDNITQDLTACVPRVSSLSKETERVMAEVKSFVFRADLSDESKSDWERFIGSLFQKQKEVLFEQYEMQRKQIDMLMANYCTKIEAMQSAYERRQEKLLLDNLKKLEHNKGVWVSNRIFWILLVIIEVLLITSIWAIGKSF